MAIIGDFIMLSGGENNLRLPALLVTTDTGATVTAMLGTQTVTLTEIDSGRYYGQLTDYGTWTVTGVLNGNTSTTEIVVDEVKLYQANVQFFAPDGATLNDCSWGNIHQASQMGVGANFWSVGDAKSIALSGTCGTLTLSTTLYVFIIGFDNSDNTGIIFQGFKTSQNGGTDVCLLDSFYGQYQSYSGSKYFQMNHWGNSSNYNTNFGGWAACDLRYDILGSTDVAPNSYGSVKTVGAIGNNPTSSCATSPVNNTLMSCLPLELRAVMQPMKIYTDNVGNSSNNNASVTASIDYLPLLAEFEIFGRWVNACQYEQNYQTQFTYYSVGNSRVKYSQSNTSSASYWWGRSPSYRDGSDFCNINNGGTESRYPASFSHGLAPMFLV